MDQIECIPHEPAVKSASPIASAVRDGDEALSQGHCQQAVADYQVFIDQHPDDGKALFRQFLAALSLMKQSGDRRVKIHDGELAYHDADLGVAAAPNNPVFLVCRANARVMLTPAHMLTRSAFTMKHYLESEYAHSYDDVTAAIALQPNYGQAYAARWMIDNQRNDVEQAAYDRAQAQKYDPRALAVAERMQDLSDKIVEQRRRAMESVQMHLAAALGGFSGPVYEYDL